MNILKGIAILATAATVSACDKGPNKISDGYIDSKDLTQLRAGIWIDPNGCDHWIIDDGFEGYLSQRLDRFGKPVCSGAAPPGTATKPFKDGSNIPDLI